MEERNVSLQNKLNADENEAFFTVSSFSAHISRLTDLQASSITELLESLPSYKSQSSSTSAPEFKQLFQELILNLNEGGRLGTALSEPETKDWLEALFCAFMSDQTVHHLLRLLQDWDAYSFYHSIDVFLLGTLLARRLEIEDIESFALGCLLHDVGKRLIPQTVLSKKSKLTETEFQMVQYHAEFGSIWLDLLGFPEPVKQLALLHHERLNRSGYPNALDEDQLNDAWRIIAVVDVFSALTLKRTYREPLSSPRALEILLNDNDKLSERMTYSLADTLQLFPPQSEVVLSNGERATIILISESIEDGCHLKIRETGALTAFSQYPPTERFKMVGWKSHRLDQWQKDLWVSFVNGLIEKDTRTITYFEELADGKRVEEIYRDILGKMAHEVRNSFLQGSMSETHRASAIHSALQIMNEKLVEYAPSYRLSIEEGIAFLPFQEAHTFPLRLLHDVLFVNGWKTYFIKGEMETTDMMENRLKPILEKDFVKYIALSITDNTDTWLLSHLLTIINHLKPSIEVILYYRYEGLLETIDTDKLHFYSNDFNQFLSFLSAKK